MLLELKNIHAGYNCREILRGIDLKINSGEIVAIIGPNGAGKSTSLKVVSGFLLPKKGKVVFDDIDITNLEANKRISMGMSYFLQGGEVFSDMSVYENLELGGANLKKSTFKERFEETLDIFPVLKGKVTKRAGLLSGGERQMLALGMIILNRPKLLLLDEPSAGLAPGLVKGILEKIVEINKAYGIAILLIEQKVDKALKISDKVYLFVDGKVASESKHESLGGVQISQSDLL